MHESQGYALIIQCKERLLSILNTFSSFAHSYPPETKEFNFSKLGNLFESLFHLS